MPLPTMKDVSAVDQVLTNMATAYEQADSRFVAMRAFPAVPVDNRSGTYYTFTKKYFFLDDMAVRAPGGPFNSLDYGVGTDTFSTIQWASDHAIPDENRAANQAPLSLEQAALTRLTQAAMIRKERAFSTDFMITGVWGTDDNNATTDWDDYSAGDPVNDIIVAQRTIGNNTGSDANTLVMGRIVFDALRNHPDIIDRLKYVQIAGQDNIAAAIAGIFGMSQVLVSRASYNTANENATFSGAAIVDDDCLVCYVAPGANSLTATAGKTFVWQPGGGAGSVYRDRDNARHSDVVQYKMQWDQKAVSTDCGYFFADVV